MRLARRDALFDVHLIGDEGLAIDRRGLGVDVEVAVTSKLERRLGGRGATADDSRQCGQDQRRILQAKSASHEVLPKQRS